MKHKHDDINIENGVKAKNSESVDAISHLVESLQEQLAKAEASRDESNNAYLRLRADFDNFRKRVSQERMLDRQKGIEEFVTQLLPIIDNFDRAMEASKASQSFESMSEGVTIIHKQLVDLLQKNDITPIQAEGTPFDPNLHDAIQRVIDPNEPDNTVVGEAERGYRMGDKIIRHSKVLVSVRPENGG